ncbi:MAG: GNAT family protein, partial [Myxococcaceae bacterium]
PPLPEGTDPVEHHLARIRMARGAFDLDQNWTFVAEELATGKLIGEVCLLTRAGIAAREVGYWVAEAGLRRGFATEMAAAMVRVAFELEQMKRVDLMITPGNEGSVGVARKLGFTLEGRLRDRQLLPHHTRGDLFSFTLLDSEYPTSPARAVEIEAFDMLDRRVF